MSVPSSDNVRTRLTRQFVGTTSIMQGLFRLWVRRLFAERNVGSWCLHGCSSRGRCNRWPRASSDIGSLLLLYRERWHYFMRNYWQSSILQWSTTRWPWTALQTYIFQASQGNGKGSQSFEECSEVSFQARRSVYQMCFYSIILHSSRYYWRSAHCSEEEQPSVCSGTVDAATSCMEVSLLEPPKKVCKIEAETIDDTATKIWLQLEKAHLTSHNKFLLTSGAMLNDHYINKSAQKARCFNPRFTTNPTTRERAA